MESIAHNLEGGELRISGDKPKVCGSQKNNTLGKGMNPIILPPAMGK